MLPHIRLGKTELRISRLGLGTVKLGRNQQVKYPEPFELPSDADAKRLLHLARDLGINLLDTAPAYGASEERLGELLRGQRKEWVICSKAGERFNGYESEFDFSGDGLRKSLDRSLRRLGTDFIDILLIHSDGNDSDIIHRDEVFHTLAQFKQQGWIRAFGISSKTHEGNLLCAAEADVLMMTFDAESEKDQEVLALCEQKQCGVLLKKIFNSGKSFTNKEQNTTSTSDFAIAEQMQLIFSHKAINSAIIGTLNRQHLRDNVTHACDALID